MKVLLAANINSMHTLRWLQALNDRGLRLVVFSLTDVSPGNQGVPAGVKVYQAGFPPARGTYSQVFTCCNRISPTRIRMVTIIR